LGLELPGPVARDRVRYRAKKTRPAPTRSQAVTQEGDGERHPEDRDQELEPHGNEHE